MNAIDPEGLRIKYTASGKSVKADVKLVVSTGNSYAKQFTTFLSPTVTIDCQPLNRNAYSRADVQGQIFHGKLMFASVRMYLTGREPFSEVNDALSKRQLNQLLIAFEFGNAVGGINSFKTGNNNRIGLKNRPLDSRDFPEAYRSANEFLEAIGATVRLGFSPEYGSELYPVNSPRKGLITTF